MTTQEAAEIIKAAFASKIYMNNENNVQKCVYVLVSLFLSLNSVLKPALVPSPSPSTVSIFGEMFVLSSRLINKL